MGSRAADLVADPGLSSGRPPAGRRRRCLKSPPRVPLLGVRPALERQAGSAGHGQAPGARQAVG